MESKFTLTQTTIDFLKKNSGQKFTARKIAEWIFETYPDECYKKQKKSKAKNIQDSEELLLKQIVAEIGAHLPRKQKTCAKIKSTEGRPRKYYFTESSDSSEIDQAENRTEAPFSTTNESPIKEYDLYPILSAFLTSELQIDSIRIDEKKSRNSRGAGGNKWLYPDLVGIEYLNSDWNREIKDCVKQYADKITKLSSFEVKILINRSNVREAFFQTVSNSSWANFAYLVASEIEGADAMKELRILASLHGVGFIQLDIDNPSESQIIIPAKERNQIDWDTANRLTEENKDFLEYIKRIRQFYQTGENHNPDRDKTSTHED